MDDALLLGFADLHLGDRNHLLRSLTQTLTRAIELVRQNRPTRVTTFFNGDAVAGRGIFRGQEAQNVLQLGEEQVLVAAWTIRWFVVQLSLAAGIPIEEIEIHLILGHHDHSNRENLSMRLAATLRLLGLSAWYHGREWLSGPWPGYGYILARHGHGKSDYYAVTFSEIRGAWKEVVDRAIETAGDVVIRRLVFAHSHWFNVGIPLTRDLEADVLGSWARPEESKLNWYPDRPTGALAYHFPGEGVEIHRLEPDRKVFWSELRDADLPLDNLAAAAQILKEVSTWARAQGMIP